MLLPSLLYRGFKVAQQEHSKIMPCLSGSRECAPYRRRYSAAKVITHAHTNGIVCLCTVNYPFFLLFINLRIFIYCCTVVCTNVNANYCFSNTKKSLLFPYSMLSCSTILAPALSSNGKVCHFLCWLLCGYICVGHW